MQKSKRMIEIIKLNKWFSQFHVLKDIDLKIADGENWWSAAPLGQENQR